MSETAASAPASFAEEITNNQFKDNPEATVDSQVVELQTSTSKAGMRLRGLFTWFGVKNARTGELINVLRQPDDLGAPKALASHPMSPAGEYTQEEIENGTNIGGQHGPYRWADYHVFEQPDGPNGEKRVAMQAMRSDGGVSLERLTELGENSFTTHTTIRNPGNEEVNTSLGDHDYYELNGKLADLRVNGKTLEELLGEEGQLVEGKGALFQDFNGQVTVDFPAGHSISISAAFEGDTSAPLAMWIWRKPDTNFICFEPVVGVGAPREGSPKNGLHLAPGGSATLTKRIDVQQS